jgi:hypothetical protein
MENNNLTELNNVLFETLRGVQSGDVDSKQAQTVTNISNSIINNVKTQLLAFKATQGKAYRGAFGLQETNGLVPALGQGKYELMSEYALSKGYKSVTDAMEKIGKSEFVSQFNNWAKQ